MEEELLREQSKTHSEIIAAWIGDRQNRFDALMKILMGVGETAARRASWTMCHCLEIYPQLGATHMESLIKVLDNKTTHGALRRHAARILQTLPLPEDLMARIFDSCLNALNDLDEPIGVRVYCMAPLARICGDFPELSNEVILAIAQGMPHGTPAYKARGRMTLRDLEKPKKRAI